MRFPTTSIFTVQGAPSAKGAFQGTTCPIQCQILIIPWNLLKAMDNSIIWSVCGTAFAHRSIFGDIDPTLKTENALTRRAIPKQPAVIWNKLVNAIIYSTLANPINFRDLPFLPNFQLRDPLIRASELQPCLIPSPSDPRLEGEGFLSYY